ncbi:MAG: hypothetical protein B0D87_07940 [Candidatus Sedimenticola endophacoides]|nr:MAG: hypothetical protein B0D87_07940 [Candidatus Sedimenticola endophacoides]
MLLLSSTALGQGGSRAGKNGIFSENYGGRGLSVATLWEIQQRPGGQVAEIIPELNQRTLARMTAGEKRLARRLKTLLGDDYLVWYDIPVGRQRRYPDFIR